MLKPGAKEFQAGLAHGWQGPQYLTITCCLTHELAGSCKQAVARIWERNPGLQREERGPNLLHHHHPLPQSQLAGSW